jgi:hypothetical protein
MPTLIGTGLVLLSVGCTSNVKSDMSSSVKSDASAPSSHTAIARSHPTTPVPTPPNTCVGITSTADAYKLVNAGAAVALVSISVSQAPGDTVNDAREVPIDSFQVVAGALPDPNLTQISEDSNGKDNVLLAGQYLVLVGGTDASNYYLADGLPGSFVVQGDNAFERCPNYADTSQPLEIHSGITSIDQLDSIFSDAINEHNAGSSSTPSGQPTSPAGSLSPSSEPSTEPGQSSASTSGSS